MRVAFSIPSLFMYMCVYRFIFIFCACRSGSPQSSTYCICVCMHIFALCVWQGMSPDPLSRHLDPCIPVTKAYVVHDHEGGLSDDDSGCASSDDDDDMNTSFDSVSGADAVAAAGAWSTSPCTMLRYSNIR